MDAHPAFRRLPEVYARALQLRVEGCSRETIARVMGLDVSSVGPLLEIADAKLRNLLEEAVGEGGPPPANAGPGG